MDRPIDLEVQIGEVDLRSLRSSESRDEDQSTGNKLGGLSMVSYLALSVPSTRLSLLFVYPDQPPRLTPLISISGDLAYRLSHLQPLDLRWEGRMKVRETRELTVDRRKNEGPPIPDKLLDGESCPAV